MTKPKKTFDCIEMKRAAERKLLAEYESRKGEFSSYVAFLNAKATESPWQRAFWAKVSAPPSRSK